MKLRRLALLTILFALAPAAHAQIEGRPVHEPHQYSAYEQLVLKNVSEFHKNYNARNFDKNGELVADDIVVDSNGVEVRGRDAFVKRIARLTKVFSDVHIEDLEITVDGNMAVVRFLITGTQTGDLDTSAVSIPATGKKIQIDGIEFFTFNKDGKVTHLVTVEDLASMVRQLRASN
jgi:steroid delta-isomerase-like uncharacterized protein